MTLYLFECEPCQISFNAEGKMSKPPKRRKCPQCGEYCQRVFTAPGLKFIGDFYTNRAKAEKFREKGYDKVQAHEFLNSAIKHSEERMSDGYKAYKTVSPNMDHMVKTGTARKVSEEKAKVKKESHKNLTIEAHKVAGLDPTKPKHPQGAH